MSLLQNLWRKVRLFFWMAREELLGVAVTVGSIVFVGVVYLIFVLLDITIRLSKGATLYEAAILAWGAWARYAGWVMAGLVLVALGVITWVIAWSFRDAGGWKAFRRYCEMDWAERRVVYAVQRAKQQERLEDHQEKCAKAQAERAQKIRSIDRKIRCLEGAIKSDQERLQETDDLLRLAEIMLSKGSKNTLKN